MSFIRFDEQDEPATPPSGKAALYVDQADSEVAVKKDDGSVQKFLAAVSSVNGFTGDVTLTSEDIDVLRVGSSTFSTAQHFLNLISSAGVVSGGVITDAGGGAVDVSSGNGFIRVADDETSDIRLFDWPASNGITIPVNTIRYIGVEYNAGSPQVVVKSTDVWNFDTEFPLGSVVNESNTVYIGNRPWQTGDTLTNIIERFDSSAFIERDNRAGGLIIGETGTRNVTVSAGGLLSRMDEFTISAIDTSGVDRFDVYYRNGSGGFTKIASQSQFDNTSYDNGSGTLAPLTSGYFASIWFYLTIDGKMVAVYGTAEFSVLADLEGNDIAPSVPPRIENLGILIGRVAVQQGSPSAAKVSSSFQVTLPQVGVTDHGSLVGLGDDDHPQYHTDARAVSWLATQRFVSAPQAITAAGPITLPHGLGAVPIDWYVILENVTPEHGYSTGERTMPGNNKGTGTNNQGFSARPNATNMNIRYGAGSGGGSPVFSVTNANTGVNANITNANWNAIFVAKLY